MIDLMKSILRMLSGITEFIVTISGPAVCDAVKLVILIPATALAGITRLGSIVNNTLCPWVRGKFQKMVLVPAIKLFPVRIDWDRIL